MDFHVQCNPESGVIHAGVVAECGDKWDGMSDVTEEALVAVRDHLLFIASKNNLNDGVAYGWTLSDGSGIKLTVELIPSPAKDNLVSNHEAVENQGLESLAENGNIK